VFYIMPLLLRDGSQRDRVRVALRERHGVQTSVHYPSVHRLRAYRERWPGTSLPRTEAASSREITVPLFEHMSDSQLDRVILALEAEIPG
jgi:dTDP-4-amino-4,6-dideoxygalactose transaminase